MRIGQRDDLPAIRRVGQDFLIPRHGRVENDLADRSAVRPDRIATKHRAIRKSEDGRLMWHGHTPIEVRMWKAGGGFPPALINRALYRSTRRGSKYGP